MGLTASQNQHWHPLCYWPITKKQLSKMCPELQVLSSYFLRSDLVGGQLDEHQAKNVRRENVSTLICVQSDNTWYGIIYGLNFISSSEIDYLIYFSSTMTDQHSHWKFWLYSVYCHAELASILGQHSFLSGGEEALHWVFSSVEQGMAVCSAKSLSCAALYDL